MYAFLAIAVPTRAQSPHLRNRHFLLLDTLGLLLAPSAAVVIRLESFDWPEALVSSVLLYTIVTLPLRVGIAGFSGLYSALWERASIEDLERIIIAGILAGGVSGALGLMLAFVGALPADIPRSALLLDAGFTLVSFATPRLWARTSHNRRRRSNRQGAPTIVVGAGDAGQLIARESRMNPLSTHEVLAFLDDDPDKLGKYLNGVRVAGRLADLPHVVALLGVQEVIIAMPNVPGAMIRRVVEMASRAGANVRTLPSLHDIVEGKVSISTLRPVEIQDLLRREPITTDLGVVRTLAEHRVVLVTGAGGSIGSELCRQIAALDPALLVALDHSENQVFEIHGELSARFPKLRIAPVIADIRDAGRLGRIFEQYHPFAVFHAAAHKHVPLMEENIVEAVTNNILGTRNVVQMATAIGTQHLVLISTDKAVRPTSIMGATKNIAELIVRRAALSSNRHYVAVRFGNVLGSRGSVVPTFLRQIEKGGPVTVTHPEMRRYFMTIPEAVQLVLQAGAQGEGGELFVLDMGDPVKIVDLARDLIRLSGFEEDSDIKIQFTGLRPGEKLYEEVLFGDEDIRPTEHPKVIRVLASNPPDSIETRVDDLIRLATMSPDDEARMRGAIIDLVPDFILAGDANPPLPLRPKIQVPKPRST